MFRGTDAVGLGVGGVAVFRSPQPVAPPVGAAGTSILAPCVNLPELREREG
jgi:hypothetical protein